MNKSLDPLDGLIFQNGEYVFKPGNHINVPVGSIYSPKDDYENFSPRTTEAMNVEVVRSGFSNLPYKHFEYNAYVSYMDENDRERFLLVTNELWEINLRSNPITDLHYS